MRIFCTYCGAANAAGTPLCIACATPLTAPPSSSNAAHSEYPAVAAHNQGQDYTEPPFDHRSGMQGDRRWGSGAPPVQAAPGGLPAATSGQPPLYDQGQYAPQWDYSYQHYYPGLPGAGNSALPVIISRDMLAGVWPRLGAYILDSVLVGFSMVSTLIIAGIISTTLLESFWPLFSLFGPALYFVTAWATSGQTIGYRAMGLQLIHTDGTKPDLRTAIVRYMGVIACLFVMFPCLLGFLWMLWDDRKQTWHDKIANTLVVKA